MCQLITPSATPWIPAVVLTESTLTLRKTLQNSVTVFETQRVNQNRHGQMTELVLILKSLYVDIFKHKITAS